MEELGLADLIGGLGQATLTCAFINVLSSG